MFRPFQKERSSLVIRSFVDALIRSLPSAWCSNRNGETIRLTILEGSLALWIL